MQAVTYRLSVFEGPLDLLLQLIERNKLDITDIPIALLLEQYLAVLHQAEAADVESMSEFVQMASQLMLIKSAALLPREEGEADPREQLHAMLADYLRVKELAAELALHFDRSGRRLFVKQREHIALSPPRLRPHDPEDLIEGYRAVFRGSLRRIPPPVETFAEIIVHKATSVATKIFSLLRGLITRRSINMNELLLQQQNRSDVVATFMAVLELSRERRVRLEGSAEDVTITLLGR